MVEATQKITCDLIMVERDRLALAAMNKLNQLASTGTAMVVEGTQGLTLQHIFASWHPQCTPMPTDPQDCPSELNVQMLAMTANFLEI
jgi:hypothetical protein